LHRVASADGTLVADLGVAPLSAGRWVAGKLSASRAGDEAGRWDGEFVVVTQLRDGFLFERDALGVCPLYCTRIVLGADEVWLASCSAAELRAVAGGAMRVDPVALLRFLGTGAVAGRAATLFAGVTALERGRGWRLRGRALDIEDVDQVACAASSQATTAARVDATREWLLATARDHDEANLALPVSGGIDSSGLLAAFARVRGAGVPAYTFSQRDAAPAVDEARWARLATEAAGAVHHVLHLEPDRIPSLMRDAGMEQEFPFASPVVLAQRALFQRAAEDGVRVLLGGHGPDLLCGGADSHIALRMACAMRAGHGRDALALLQGARRHVSGSAMRWLASACRQAMTGRSAVEPRVLDDPWLAPAWIRTRVADAPQREWLDFPAATRPLQALIDRQLTRSLGVSSLLYERANAAAAGLEVRQPYLRASFRSLMLACEDDELVSRHGQPKWILRAALRDMVPALIVARERRIGFAVPAVQWLLRNRAWVDAQLVELRGLPAWGGPAPAHFWPLLQRPGAQARRTAARTWRWLSLLEWSRGHDARFD
jgi:asparagine synthase (glutamine-hydrolysing)